MRWLSYLHLELFTRSNREIDFEINVFDTNYMTFGRGIGRRLDTFSEYRQLKGSKCSILHPFGSSYLQNRIIKIRNPLVNFHTDQEYFKPVQYQLQSSWSKFTQH